MPSKGNDKDRNRNFIVYIYFVNFVNQYVTSLMHDYSLEVQRSNVGLGQASQCSVVSLCSFSQLLVHPVGVFAYLLIHLSLQTASVKITIHMLTIL